MKIEHYHKVINNYNIPCIEITPEMSKGRIILMHGFGGNKEEQLGLGLRIAETAFSVCIIDLPGHGENKSLFPENIDSQLNSLIDYYKNAGETVVAIGHSVGGRLALTSNADYFIGISPTLTGGFSEGTQSIIRNMRDYRVNLKEENALWDLQNNLPFYDINRIDKTLIIVGSRDVPEIIKCCMKLKNDDNKVYMIENALHSDIFLNEETFELINNQLRIWFNKKQ
jgi:hypothetical protein